MPRKRRWLPCPTTASSRLCKIYQPQEDHASVAGIGRHGRAEPYARGERRPAGPIREAGCLVLVAGALQAAINPLADAALAGRLAAADMEIVSGRIERLRESVKKPRPGRDAGVGRAGRAGTARCGLGVGHAARGRRHERGATQGHPVVSPVDRKAQPGAGQHGRRRGPTRSVSSKHWPGQRSAGAQPWRCRWAWSWSCRG